MRLFLQWHQALGVEIMSWSAKGYLYSRGCSGQIVELSQYQTISAGQGRRFCLCVIYPILYFSSLYIGKDHQYHAITAHFYSSPKVAVVCSGPYGASSFERVKVWLL